MSIPIIIMASTTMLLAAYIGIVVFRIKNNKFLSLTIVLVTVSPSLDTTVPIFPLSEATTLLPF